MKIIGGSMSRQEVQEELGVRSELFDVTNVETLARGVARARS